MLTEPHLGGYGTITPSAQAYRLSRTCLLELLFVANLQLATLLSDDKRLTHYALVASQVCLVDTLDAPSAAIRTIARAKARMQKVHRIFKSVPTIGPSVSSR